MKKIYLTKQFIKWNDVNVSKDQYRSRALPILAYSEKSKAIKAIKSLIKNARKRQCDLYKNYYFIEEIVVY